MARQCPVCGKGTLKAGEKMVYCEDYKPKKDGNDWINEGSCDFHIGYKNPAWGNPLTSKDVIALLEGKMLTNKKGDKMTLDLDSEFYTHIEFKEKKPDRDL